MRVFWGDLWFCADLRPAEGAPGHVVDFELYEIISMAVLEAEQLDAGRTDGLKEHQNYEVKKVAHGHVKWDGCCNYDFEPDDAMRHECGRDGFRKLMTAFLRVYDEAEKVMGRKIEA